MKIEKVTYQKTYSIGPYLTDRVGFEATLEKDETPDEALGWLKMQADDWHREANPHLYQDTKDITLPQYDRTPSYMPLEPGILPTISRDKERLEITIDNAETPEDLKAIKADNPLLPASLINHYNKRMTDLTAGRPQNFTDGLS